MPYMNTNYYNQYPQYQPQYSNPYMDRINNLQQYQQSLQPQPPQPQNTLGGKVVDSIDAVKATDIPMDGNLYYFPKADGTELYAKHWLNNGTTEIITYKPYLPQESSQSLKTLNSPPEAEKAEIKAINTLTEEITKRFDDINARFDKLEKSVKSRNTTSRAKKEEAEE